MEVHACVLGQAWMYVLRGCTWKQPCKEKDEKEGTSLGSGAEGAGGHVGTGANVGAARVHLKAALQHKDTGGFLQK